MLKDFTENKSNPARSETGQVESVLRPGKETRDRLWKHLTETLENYFEHPENLPLHIESDVKSLQKRVADCDFETPVEPLEALDAWVDFLFKNQIHHTNPNYFGLFDPASSFTGILAETLVAGFNPQLSVWSACPGAVEIEQHLIRAFGEKFGYRAESVDGNFTTGGAEANHTAILAALAQTFPDFAEKGLRALAAQPVVYVSVEGHHSVIKAARLCGLGNEFIRRIEVDRNYKMDVARLSEKIAADRREGLKPFLIVATAGTTSSGAIDPLPELKDVAAREEMWMHTDAAWGGAVRLVPEYRDSLDGLEFSDSITFDPHKLLSMPRGTGMFLTRHPAILEQLFQVSPAYMPPKPDLNSKITDPFSHSIQWSRRFTGFKLFLTLLMTGWDGYAEIIRHHLKTGQYLRQKLEESGWQVVNDTSLAVVCFVDGTHDHGGSPVYLEDIWKEVRATKKTWFSMTKLAASKTVLRACITNYQTGAAEADNFVQGLDRAREKVLNKNTKGQYL